MKKFRTLVILAAFMIFSGADKSHAGTVKEFITASTYGVLTGTLVGVASLAFSDQPGDNLQNVARGASLGLYLGIALGAYVVYGVPSQDEPEYDESELALPEARTLKFNIGPTIANNKFDGVMMHWHVATF